MNIKNNIGPRTDPCGKPVFILKKNHLVEHTENDYLKNFLRNLTLFPSDHTPHTF